MTTRNIFIDMNSEAVSLMQQGNNNAASKLLRKALRGLKETLTPDSQSDHSLQDDISMDYEDIQVQSVPVSQPQLGLEGAVHDNILPFYCRAMLLPQTSENQEDNARTAVVVLFNLGLLHHCQALFVKSKQGEIDLHLLSQARDFYDAAQKVAFTSWTEDAFYDLYSVVLALANNLGHIYGQSRSRLYDFSRMNSQLAYLVKLVRYPSLSLYVSEEDNEFFYLSVFTFLDASSSLGIAPAA